MKDPHGGAVYTRDSGTKSETQVPRRDVVTDSMLTVSTTTV